MFGQELKSARKAAGKKLREVADYSGLTISIVSDLEHGRRRPPSSETIKKIENFLGVVNGRLCKSAAHETEIKTNVREIFSRRPELSYALLRAAEGLSDEEVNGLIKTMSQGEGD